MTGDEKKLKKLLGEAACMPKVLCSLDPPAVPDPHPTASPIDRWVRSFRPGSSRGYSTVAMPVGQRPSRWRVRAGMQRVRPR